MAAQGRDPHTALKRDVVSRVNREHFEAVLARLQWGKDDVAFSLQPIHRRMAPLACRKPIFFRT